jgi:hypothetical protein
MTDQQPKIYDDKAGQEPVVITNIVGEKRWYVNKLKHRTDGPALEFPNGSKHWYLHGERHREDGPAIENVNGVKVWFINGKRHRTDGPASIDLNNLRSWWIHGKLHRLDGPAVDDPEKGRKMWYVYGKNITKQVQIWSQENNIDLNNMTDGQKMLFKLTFA